MSTRISQLTAATSLDGSELLEIVQAGTSKRGTAQQVSRLAAEIYAATSTTSLAIGTGSKSLTTQTYLAYRGGAFVTISDANNPDTNYMSGIVTSYAPTTGAMTVNVTVVAGSGTIANWNIQPSGTQGIQGNPGSPWDGWQGAWLTATAYVSNDAVDNDGASYICTADHTSGASTEPGTGASWASYWDVLAEKGDTGTAATISVGTVTTGAAGSSASVTNVGTSSAAVFNFAIPRGDTGDAWDGWQGAWLTATAYALNDAVENDGSSYICTQAHTSGAASEPGTGGSWASYWDVLAAKGADGLGSGDMTVAVYDAAGIAEQLVGTTATQTLTNKTLTAQDITVAATPSAPGSSKLRLYGVAAPGSADTLAYKNSSGLVRYLQTLGAEVLIPENYGSIGDNSTNDYTALQAMFDSVSNVSVTQKHRPTVVLFTPGKIYVTGTTLKIQQYNVHVIGMGAGIRMTGTGPALMVDHANSVNSVPGVNISGLHIQANTGAGDHGIHARSAPQIRITDCHFKDFASAGSSTVCCGGHAILLEGCVSSTVADNEIDKPGSSGIYVKAYNKNYSGQPTPTGNTTSGSAVISGMSSTTGISVGMGVSGTGIQSASVVSSVDSSTQITISKTASASNSGVTLTFSVLAESQAVTIERNRVFAAGSIGILVSEGGGMKVYNNDVEGCTGGLEVRSSYHFEIISNYFETSSTDIAVRNTVDLIAAREVLGGLIVGNTCESTAGINLVDGDDIHVFHNRISGTATIASACARPLWGPQSEMTGSLTDSSTTTRYLPTIPADPGADRILFWDDSAGTYEYLTAGSGLSISGTTITATGSMGGTTGATDNRVLRADGAGGATIQSSAVTIDDSGNVSGVINLTVGGAITLGNGGSAASSGDFYWDAGTSGSGAFHFRGGSGYSEKIKVDTNGATITTDRGLLFTSQTSGSGSATGTLTNAPTAGNPGHWLKIKIGGTDYVIPAWAG